MNTFATPEDQRQQEDNERTLLMRLIAFAEDSGIPQECGDRICTLKIASSEAAAHARPRPDCDGFVTQPF